MNQEVLEEDLGSYLGVKKYNFGEIETENKVGVATGLAWTEAGGEILKIESVFSSNRLVINGFVFEL